MAFISAFQAEDGGSIPPTRSLKNPGFTRIFCLFAKEIKYEIISL